jgi:oxalate decarboxylase/phosphoglucose isomerase-like protein (cupin superfamily)
MTRRQLRFVFIPAALMVVVLIWFLYAHRARPTPVEITADPAHHLALENEYVRAFKVEVGPNASTLLHRHGHDYIYVSLGISQIENNVAGKSPVKLALQDGETRFVPGGFAHITKNLSDRPFRNVTIELIQDQKARHSPPPNWGANGNEERGVEVLNGGTSDILFVNDGVRASQLDLQPGGILPKHHHAGPHLIVAVTDLDLRGDIEGSAPAQIQVKAGDVVWINGDTTHALTNIGKQDAKLITLEFP